MIAALLDRFHQGDRNALSRLLSLVARGESIGEIQAAILASPSRRGVGGEGRTPSRVIAFTGSGGVGKSTLLGKLIALVRSENRTVAVLACDPQSPLSGGALLGDRFRMGSTVDDGLFIRSLAALSGHGALADHLDVMIQLLETFGFDVIFLETVGAGQGDVTARQYSDGVVLLLQPEAGDDVQWEKAGILECADIVVVNKADLPGADQTAAQVRAALDLSPAREVPVVRVSTKANTGHAELWEAIQALPLRRKQPSVVELILQASTDWLKQEVLAALDAKDPEFDRILDAFQKSGTSREMSIRELLRHLVR